MHRSEDDGPVYYREIQKNAYLKRLPTDQSSKLLPLVHKKPPLKPMWTLLCVHNGRTPYLEQYPEAECAEALAHKPVWRACLDSARHVTSSVAPYIGREHDFLIDTDRGAVRMLAPDWVTMQDWVTTLRSKLAELRIVSRGENVYGAPPAPPPPRAGSRDPTSPLPPPPAPPSRVPGIELPETTHTAPIQTETDPEPEPTPDQNENREPIENQIETENVDISQWDSNLDLSQPSTSLETKKAVKICGQNIALDDSILKRTSDSNDVEFEVDSAASDSESVREEVLSFDEDSECYKKVDFKQRLLIGGESAQENGSGNGKFQGTNITVIQVSNKAPHTAIPVLGSETDVFDFEFKQKLTIDEKTDTPNDFVNIVNTENGYGTVFDTKESDYGHLSLTTTVNLTGVTENGVYERLCMASTSNEAVKKVKSIEKCRKSSLPNMEVNNPASTYECIFPGNSVSQTIFTGNNDNTNISVVSTRTENNTRTELNNSRTELNCSRPELSTARPEPNLRPEQSNLRPEHSKPRPEPSSLRPEPTNLRPEPTNLRPEQSNVRPELSNLRPEPSTRPQRTAVLTNSVSVGASNIESSRRQVNVERSHSQTSYDNVRHNRKLYSSPKRDGKIEKMESTQPKPIWKRGLTELSLLTRLKGLALRERRSDPQEDRRAPSPGRAVPRSRPDVRQDGIRRRSSSWSDDSIRARARAPASLRAREALALRAEQARGAPVDATVSYAHTPIFVDYNNAVWIAWWGGGGGAAGGRSGDRAGAVRGALLRGAAQARQLARSRPPHPINILFHRVPLGKIYLLNKNSDNESLGIKLDSECGIQAVSPRSPAARAALPAAGWSLTEVNNRPINLLKGGEEDMNRLSQCGREVTVLIQPTPLVKKIRAALKANKSVLSR